MTLSALAALAIGLAMDATAVAAARGLAAPSLRARHFALVAGCFGGAQAAMPLLGWLVGSALGPRIAAWDHWIAFALLGGIGAKMLWEARGTAGAGGADEGAADRDPFGLRVILVLALATSIDAFAAGITLPLLDAPIAVSVTAIGVVTATLSAAGLALGHRVGARAGARFGRGLEAFGGVVLIALGAKILIEHLG